MLLIFFIGIVWPNLRLIVAFKGKCGVSAEDWTEHIQKPVKQVIPVKNNQLLSCGATYRVPEDKRDKPIYRNCNDICQNGELYDWQYIPKQGGFCTLKSLISCNTSISDLVWVNQDYQCIPKYPELFGGELGNDIVGCNGTFSDKLLNVKYSRYLPKSVTINDIHETLPNKPHLYRYACTQKKDVAGNLKLTLGGNSNLASRFTVIPNVCAALVQNTDASVVSPNWDTMECDCPGNMVQNVNLDKTLPCTTCYSAWHKGGLGENLGAQYGTGVAQLCIDGNTPQYLWSLFKIPCPAFYQKSKQNCMRAVLLATTTYSPLALGVIS